MSIMDVLSKAYEADPESGKVLLDHIAMSVIAEEAAQYAKRLDPMLLDAMSNRVRNVKVATGRSYVAKAVTGEYPSDAVKVAEWLTGIDNYIAVAKEGGLHFDWFEMPTGDQRRVLRDALGRFASINGSASVQGQAVGSRNLAKPVENVTDRKKQDGGTKRFYDVQGDKDQAEEFQGGYENAVKLAGEWRDKLGSDAKDAVVEIKAKGVKAPIRITLTGLAAGQIPDSLDVSNAFTAMRVVPKDDASANARRRMDGLYANPSGFNRLEVANAMMGSFRQGGMFGSKKGDSTRIEGFFRRLGAASDVLGASGQPQLAAMAQLVGSFGPEAAKVMDPHVRRAAYRYRGTERTPDPELTHYFKRDSKRLLEHFSSELDRKDGASAAEVAASMGNFDQTNPLVNSVMYRAERMKLHGEPATGDALKLGVRSDMAAMTLLKTLPRRSLIGEISRESGRVLPSQGVIIDRDGDVITQSVGFADDHYLPFDLKNMARLKGGQYVRTRQQGGLTGEDIFASVFHGARSATVASTTGVFRVEFAPDFRGKRAMSDKAFSMYERYLEILNAVKESSDLYTVDIDPTKEAEQRAKLRAGVGRTWDQATMDSKIKEWKAGERAKARDLDPKDIEKLKEDSLAEIKENNPNWSAERVAREAQAVFMDKYEAAQDARVRELTLNGEGYALALRTLQAQFPYFIRSIEFTPLRTSADADPVMRTGRPANGFYGLLGLSRRKETLDAFPKPSRSQDKGYVRRGQLRPTFGSGKPAETKEAPSEAGAKPQTAAEKPAGTQAPAAASGGPADTESPAARAAADKAVYTEEQVKKVRTHFIANMRSLYTTMDKHKVEVESEGGPAVHAFDRDEMGKKPLTDITTKGDRLKWFFTRTTEAQIADAFDKYADTLFSDFASATPDEISLAISETWDQGAVDDLLGSGGAPFGAKTKDELYRQIIGNAMNVAEAKLYTQPFKPDTGDSIRNEFARAISFEDIASLGSAEDVDQFAKDNQELAVKAEEIGTDEHGNYLSMGQLSSRMKSTLARAVDLETAAKRYQEAVAAGNATSKKRALDSRDQIMRGGPLPGIPDEALDAMFEDGAVPDLTDALIDLQRARTLVEVGRAYDALRTSEGGGAGPKLRPGWVWKAQPSLRVEVLKADDPVSLAFQREWALGRR